MSISLTIVTRLLHFACHFDPLVIPFESALIITNQFFAAHSSTHDVDDFNERDIAARSEGYDPSDNGLEGDGVADLRLDDAFEDDDINNELDNNEREAEDGELR